MKPIPVIQPAPGQTAAERRPPKTDGMINDPERSSELRPAIIDALSTVFDPELPVNIYDLGLIYDVIVDESDRVGIRMTLTAPACPAAQVLPDRVQKVVEAIPGVADALVDVVWEPPWTRDRMSDAAKLELGMF